MLKPIGSDAPDTGGGGLHLPDSATKGPYTTDPGWSEARWWLGVPVLFAIWLLVTWQIGPGW